MSHQLNSSPPVTVAELITTEHTVMAISHFLTDFRRYEGKLYGYSGVIQPKCLVIDRSLVLLLSILKVFNMETLSDYLHRCFRIATRSQSEEDEKKTTVVACISHVMHSAKNEMQKLL